MKTSPALLLAALLMPTEIIAQQPAQSTDFTTLGATKLLDFRYSFPTVVATFPELLDHIQQDRTKAYKTELDAARDDAQGAKESGYPFHRHEFWRDWVATGQTARLIGLEQQTDYYTGGAHPNHGSSWLLWDLKQKQAIALDQLFGRKNSYWPLLKGRYCAALARERKRRDMTNLMPCPAPDKLTVEFLDMNLNWSFDTVRIIADPYVAGSYAEGTYAVTLPVTPPLIAAMKREYRDSFEVQRQ